MCLFTVFHRPTWSLSLDSTYRHGIFSPGADENWMGGESSDGNNAHLIIFNIFELVVMLVFIFDALVFFIGADSPLQYLCSEDGICDLVAAVPIGITRPGGPDGSWRIYYAGIYRTFKLCECTPTTLPLPLSSSDAPLHRLLHGLCLRV